MKIQKITNVSGGMVSLYPSEMKDHQFELIKNMTYDKDKRLRSRGGLKSFGEQAPNKKSFTSIFFFQNDATFERNLFGVAGDILYKFDEAPSVSPLGKGGSKRGWKEIKTGLKEFEKDWITRTRWSFAVYRNVVYMCDGVNPYASYDGTSYVEYPEQPKCRYIEYMADTLFGAGDDENPSTLYWTDSAWENANNISQNIVVVWGDELGRINGIKEMGQIILVFKNKKIYTVDIQAKSSIPLNTFNGGYADRSIKNVGGAMFYQSDLGIDVVQSRQAVTGVQGLETKTKTEDLRSIIDKIANKDFNASVSSYIPEYTNYYYCFDASKDHIADTTLVYSSVMGSWVQYDFPSLYDFWYFLDKNGEYRYLIAPSNNGQLLEIEKWLNDNGFPIECEIVTKKWDFWEISLLKTFQQVDITGLKSRIWSIQLEVFVDDELVQSAQIGDEFIKQDEEVLLFGSKPLWVNVLSTRSESEDRIKLYRYIARLPLYVTGTNIQIKMRSKEDNFIWTYEGVNIGLDTESFELIDEQFLL